MKAARWYGRKDVRVEEVPEPSSGKGEVKIKVEWCGICGTDLHEYEAGPIFIPTSPHPITGKTPPVTLGHEFSGTIVEIGDGVSGWKKGDRVTADACIVCGECYSCKHGMYHLCEKLGFNGLALDGGFAEYVVVPAYQLYKLDERMSFEEGALIEPISVGVHAVRGRLKEGDTAAVIGAGTIGLVTLQAAKAAGATKIYVLEIAEKRKEFAKQFGADAVIDPTKEDAIEAIKKLNGGIGVDVAFECVGKETTLTEAIQVTHKGGRIVVAGIFAGPFSGNIPYNDISVGEREVVGSIAYNRGEFQYSIDFVADGRIKAKELVTKKISLNEIVDGGFEELLEHRDKHVKILVTPKK